MDNGLILITISIILEIILGLMGDYWNTCGMGVLDILLTGLSIILSIILYQNYKRRSELIKWMIAIGGCGLNLSWGVMFYTIIC